MNVRKISRRTVIISMVAIIILVAGIAVYFNLATIKDVFIKDAVAAQQDIKNDYKEPVISTEQYTKAASGNYDIVFGLDSWIGGTPIIYGLEKGVDKKYSLKIGIENLNDERTKMLGLKEGKIHAFEMALPIFLSMQKEFPQCGVIIGITDFSYGADGLIVKSGINNLSELKRKNITYLNDELSKYSLSQFLSKANLKYEDIQTVEHTNFEEMMDDINSGKADAVVASDQSLFTILNYVNEKEQNFMKLLLSSRDIPDFMPTVLVFNNEFAQKHPNKVSDFLNIWFGSAERIMKDSNKSYLDILEVSKDYPDIYGSVTEEDVKQSLSGIKLMSLNGNFDYFGVNGKEIKLVEIIKNTAKLIKESGSATKEAETSNLLSGVFLESIFMETTKP